MSHGISFPVRDNFPARYGDNALKTLIALATT